MVQLTEEDARSRLEHMTQASTEPALTSDQVDELLGIAKRYDVDGLTPSDDAWTPTWDLNAAAAEGWLWKAGRVSPRFTANLDGTGLQRAQIFGHCLQMAERYASKVATSIRVGHDPDEDVLVN